MKPERKVDFLNIAIQSIIYGVLFTLLGQYAGMLETAKVMKMLGIPYEPSFSLLSFGLLQFWIPVIIGGLIGFAICFWTPVIKWGLGLAFKLKAKPGSLWFNIVVGFLVALIFVIILAPTMSILTTVLLVPEGGYKQTVAQALITAASYLWLFYPVAWLFGTFLNKPCEAISRKILNIPAPQYGHNTEPENK